MFTPNNNENLLEKSLDLIEEQREIVMVQLAYYQQKLKQGHDTSVRLRPLAPGDLVLRKVVGTAKNLAWEKLGLIGRVILHRLSSRYRCLFPRRFRRKYCTTPLECK